MSKHTPGPWTLLNSPDSLFVYPEQYGSKPGEHAANMALIATAPELLGALKLAERILSSINDHKDFCVTIKGAIAKAEGG